MNHSNNYNEPADIKNDKKRIDKIKFYGLDIRILVTGDMTENRYSMIEITFPAGPDKEVDLHKHSKEDVIVNVIEGNFVFRYGSKELKRGSGEDDTPFRLEKNIPHSYKKVGEGKGILLMLFKPAGFENLFRELARSSGSIDIDGKIDEDKLQNRKMEEDDRVLLHLLEQKYGGRFVFEQDE